jgi:hypothetical protein
MNKDDRALLIGMAIGDGYVRVCEQVKKRELANGETTFYSSINSNLIINHSAKQKQYLEYKAELIGKIFNSKPPKLTPTTTYLKKTGKTYNLYRISKGHKYFKLLRKWMYPRGIKTYTRFILNKLNAQAIAIWYMDDGFLKKIKNKEGKITSVSLCIATYCSLEEIEIITEYFRQVWGVSFNQVFCKNSNLYYLRTGTKEAKKFMEIVKPHIIPSMSYKIVDLHERQTPRTGDDIV